jgi:geranylgeranyl reductase family protein
MTPAPSVPVLDEADVVVVGGGPGGAIAAFTLASKGHDVMLIDKQSFPREKACGDGLSSSAVSFLGQLGLDEILAGAQQIEDTRLVVDWRRERKRSLSRAPRRPQRRPQGCCLPRRTFDDALVDSARRAGARLLNAMVTEPILREGKAVGVTLIHNGVQTSVSAPYIVAADGATSRLRRLMAFPSRPAAALSYAVRRYVLTQEPLEPIFDLYAPVTNPFAGYGWVFPVSQHVANIGIGYVTARGLPRPRSITDLLDSFLASLQRHRGSEFGSLKPISPARGAPVGVGFSVDRCEERGVIFVGDAARTCDPITGEGIDQAMRSAYTSALALDRAIRCRTKSLGVGHMISRSNPRLGQDSAMIARLGYRLLKRRHSEQSDSADVLAKPTPFFSAVQSMVTAEIDYPTMSATPAGRVASRFGFAKVLHTLDNQVRDQVRNEFVLCSEMLHREVCAGTGPTGALILFASQAACASMANDQSVEAALSVELLRVFTTMLSRVTEANSDQAKANNALTVMISDYAISRAIGTLATQGPVFSGMLANGIETSSEAAALLTRNQPHAGPPVQRYMEWARFTTGAAFSLAARMGARLAVAHHAVEDSLCVVGESLGIATQICEDILILRRQDSVMGGPPWRTLEQRRFGLPVLLAAEEDQQVASLLVAAKARTEWERAIDLIASGEGLVRAGEICREYAGSAKKAAVEIAGQGTSLEALCDLPLRCLALCSSRSPDDPEVLVPPAIQSAAHGATLRAAS